MLKFLLLVLTEDITILNYTELIVIGLDLFGSQWNIHC